MIKVILDTDTYNEVDDMFALAYLLKNKNLFDIKVINIVDIQNQFLIQ